MEQHYKEGQEDFEKENNDVSEMDVDHTSLSMGQYYQTKISKHLDDLRNQDANTNYCDQFVDNDETNIDAFVKQMQAERERSKSKFQELTGHCDKIQENARSLSKMLELDNSSFRLRIESLRKHLHQLQCELSRDLKQDFEDICNSLQYDPDESKSKFNCEDFGNGTH